MTADALERLMEKLLQRIENGHPQSIGSIDNTRMVQFGVDEIAHYRQEFEAALVRAGGVPQPETTAIGVRSKIFVLLAEIRQCINYDHLMAAQRKVQAIETFLQRARTHGSDGKCSRCGEPYPNHATTCIHADYERETQLLRCSGWLAPEELCPCPNHLVESLERHND